MSLTTEQVNEILNNITTGIFAIEDCKRAGNLRDEIRAEGMIDAMKNIQNLINQKLAENNKGGSK